MKQPIILASLLFAFLAPTAQADDRCSNGELHGVYSFSAAGTIVANPSPLPAGPFVAAGRTTYDGNGNASGVIQISLNGSIVPPGQASTWIGTYAMDPSTCTTTKTLTITSGPLAGVSLHFFITAGSGFSELRFIATDQYTAISGSARKQ